MQFQSALILVLCSAQTASAQPDASVAPFALDAPVAPSSVPSSMPSSMPSGSHLPTATAAPTLPPDVAPRTDYRCGVTELDARANCKPECAQGSDAGCPEGEYCWGTFLNYCHIMPFGHPSCPSLDGAEQETLRCGFDEAAARGYCGNSCTSILDCSGAESCFPVQRNFCKCFEEQDLMAGRRELQAGPDGTLTNAEYFEEAKMILSPYFTSDGSSPTTPSTPTTPSSPSTPSFSPNSAPSSAVSASFFLGAVGSIIVSLL